ncbi:MAG TPA: DivIVA domain-containing protein [Geodermatophilus sp.]|nr:DivIVA domain-containing protein [Geodermatophilus sp.]
MTTDQGDGDRRLTPADVHHVRFSRAAMLNPGYNQGEVDHFLNRVEHEMARLIAEKAELRDRVYALEKQMEGAATHVPPSDQAVRILAVAQQTADSYVAEAEDFSRQMTADARAQYEEQVRRARENAGAIIAAAQEAAAKMVAGGSQPAADAGERSTQELEEQAAYLKAFAQAVRTQLRAYLEALLTDVEAEWGRADPGALPQTPLRAPAQRSNPGAAQPGAPALNVAREVPMDDGAGDDETPNSSGGVEVFSPPR